MAVGRPRSHDPEALLDHARALWVEEGSAGLTIRALSARSGVSNGAIYHAFGSRRNLLARVWAREADAFVDFQRDLVASASADSGARGGLLAAALSLATYAEQRPEAARLLMAVAPQDLVGSGLGEDERREIGRLRRRLGALIVELADGLWGRSDAAAVALVRICVVDLPGRLLLGADRLDSLVARHAVRAAVEGIAASEPPAV